MNNTFLIAYTSTMVLISLKWYKFDIFPLFNSNYVYRDWIYCNLVMSFFDYALMICLI